MSEQLDHKKIVAQLSEFSEFIFKQLVDGLKESNDFEFASNDIVVTLIGRVHKTGSAAELLPYCDEIPELYKKLAIYRALVMATESAREGLIVTLGGKPAGEAKLKFFEDNMLRKLLPLMQSQGLDELAAKLWEREQQGEKGEQENED